MRILVFNWRDVRNPDAGGAETNIHEQAKWWVRKGHKVTLFTAGFDGGKPEESIDGIRVVRRGGRFSVYPRAKLHYSFNLRKDRPDIVIDDVNGIPFFTPLYCRRPIIVLFHHRVGRIFFKELPFPAAQLGYFIETHLFPFLYSRRPVVAVSPSTRDELVELGFWKKNISIIHNAVDTDLLEADMKKKTGYPSVCYIGRIKRYKRLDILVKAFKDVVKKHPDAKLTIGGTGDDLDNIRALVKKLKLSKNVDLPGFISDEKKLGIFQRSWIFATPSEKEGWGITTIEANACGTPVVAFDVPGLHDSVKDGYSGLLAKDELKFRKHILDIIEDKALRKKLSANAVRWSGKFSWEASADKFLDLMRKEKKKKKKKRSR